MGPNTETPEGAEIREIEALQEVEPTESAREAEIEALGESLKELKENNEKVSLANVGLNQKIGELKQELGLLKTENQELIDAKKTKTLNNTDIAGAEKQVPDIEKFGNCDLFRLISKASSKREGWMKSTKALDVGNGCIIQVTTQQGSNVAEALVFVPGVHIYSEKNSILYLNTGPRG